MIHICPTCGIEKDSNRFQVWKDDDRGVYVECISCHISQEIEDLHVRVETALFEGADRIWEKLGL